jgi:hypothetical protein
MRLQARDLSTLKRSRKSGSGIQNVTYILISYSYSWALFSECFYTCVSFDQIGDMRSFYPIVGCETWLMVFVINADNRI